LVVATATIPETFYEDWKHTYYRASTSLQNRQRNLDEAAELIERVSNTVINADPCFRLSLFLALVFHKVVYLCIQETQLKLVVADRTKPEVEIWRRPKKSTF